MKRYSIEEIKTAIEGEPLNREEEMFTDIITQLLAERERDAELLKEAFAKLDTASSMMVASPRCVAGVKSILDNLAARLKGE